MVFTTPLRDAPAADSNHRVEGVQIKLAGDGFKQIHRGLHGHLVTHRKRNAGMFHGCEHRFENTQVDEQSIGHQQGAFATELLEKGPGVFSEPSAMPPAGGKIELHGVIFLSHLFSSIADRKC